MPLSLPQTTCLVEVGPRAALEFEGFGKPARTRCRGLLAWKRPPAERSPDLSINPRPNRSRRLSLACAHAGLLVGTGECDTTVTVLADRRVARGRGAASKVCDEKVRFRRCEPSVQVHIEPACFSASILDHPVPTGLARARRARASGVCRGVSSL